MLTTPALLANLAAVAQVVRPRAQQAGGGAGGGRCPHQGSLRRQVGLVAAVVLRVLHLLLQA
jgi:hypothetical protein